MPMASYGGHLEICRWLFDVGAAEDIRTRDNDGNPPMMYASQEGHLQVCCWILMHSGCNGEDGHVDEDLVHEEFAHTPSLRSCLSSSIFQLYTRHQTFTRVVLVGTLAR